MMLGTKITHHGSSIRSSHESVQLCRSVSISHMTPEEIDEYLQAKYPKRKLATPDPVKFPSKF